MVSTVSGRYDIDKMEKSCKEIIDSPTISNDQYREACKYISNPSSFVVQYVADDNFKAFLSVTDKFIEKFKNIDVTSKIVLDLYKKQFDSFDDYKENGYGMLNCTTIRLNKDQWMLESTCDCNAFRLSFMCKHIIAFALQLKLEKLPKEGDATPISQKARRGRIQKSKKALQTQTSE